VPTENLILYDQRGFLKGPVSVPDLRFFCGRYQARFGVIAKIPPVAGSAIRRSSFSRRRAEGTSRPTGAYRWYETDAPLPPNRDAPYRGLDVMVLTASIS
jgi:hypothetical protein